MVEGRENHVHGKENCRSQSPEAADDPDISESVHLSSAEQLGCAHTAAMVTSTKRLHRIGTALKFRTNAVVKTKGRG